MNGSDDVRIPLSDAKREVAAGRALLACAYDDAAKCDDLGGEAIPLERLEGRASTMPEKQEILFICA